MGKSTMVNFRVTNTSLELIDEAAQRTGKSRSAFIREAVEAAMNEVIAGKVEPSKGRGPANKAPIRTRPFTDCPRNPACAIKRLPGGIRACEVCAWQSG